MTLEVKPPLRGSEKPRIWTRPLRRLTPKTSAGFEVIEFATDVLGIELLPWQKWLLIHALELLPDGNFRFKTVLVLAARQNGKSTVLQVWALWRLYLDAAALVIGTAQNLDVAEEVWQGAVDFAEAIPDLAAEIENVVRVNGKKALVLKGGQRYKVQAANRRGGRGLSGDMVMLDELREHQTWDAWSAVTKTTLARLRSQIVGLSNAGDDSSVVLNHLRAIALGDSQQDDDEADLSLGIFEWSAPDNCNIRDRKAWAAANPSLGYTITEKAIASALKTDPEHVFRTEVLCQRVKGYHDRLLTDHQWNILTDAKSQIDGRLTFGLDESPNRSTAAISAVGRRADGLWHQELVDYRTGVDWVVDRAVELVKKHNANIAIDPSGPAGAHIAELRLAGVEPVLLSTRDMAQACGVWFDVATSGRLRHLPQHELAAAIGGAVKRNTGDTWMLARKTSIADICPLVSGIAAMWGHITAPEPTKLSVFFFGDLDDDEDTTDEDEE